jgi:Bacterial Ig domain/Glycosyl hydrolase family 26
MLTFHHEPEDDRSLGSPADYRAAWRRVVRVFRDRRATNVVWVWNLMATTFRPAARPAAASYYPGDDVVDWIAADGYNWFGSTHVRNAPRRSFAEVFGSFYTWGSSRGKPLMIAEFGVLEDAANELGKAQWLTDARETVKTWPSIKALVYYNARGWWFDSSPPSLDAFRALTADPYFHARASTGRDNVAPDATLVSPADGAIVRRRSLVRLHLVAADPSGVRNVDFWVNGRRRCSDSAPPYMCLWRVWTHKGFSNTVRAMTYDTAGNVRWTIVQVTTR